MIFPRSLSLDRYISIDLIIQLDYGLQTIWTVHMASMMWTWELGSLVQNKVCGVGAWKTDEVWVGGLGPYDTIEEEYEVFCLWGPGVCNKYCFYVVDKIRILRHVQIFIGLVLCTCHVGVSRSQGQCLIWM